MKKLNLGIHALAGVCLSAVLMSILYLANQLAGLPFLPFDLFDWITRVLPGSVITFGIDTMIDIMRLLGVNVADTAKTAEQVIANLQYLVAAVAAVIVFYGVLKARKIRADTLSGIIMAAIFGLPQIVISIAIGQSTVYPVLKILWLGFLFLVWGWAVSWSYLRIGHLEPEDWVDNEENYKVERLDRRKFLIHLGIVSATITVVGSGIGSLINQVKKRNRDQALENTMAHRTETGKSMPFPNNNDPVMPAPGTRPEYTPIKDHYKVFIRTEPTVINGSTWVLPITGMVDNPLMLTLDDIKNRYESFDQYVTLSCISGRIGTSLIGTTQWTGVHLQDVMKDVIVRPGARYLHISSGDGFYETVDLDLIAKDNRIMLCYAWDGHDLPVDHGYPLRIWIPDRYGMKQPKWITSIEVSDTYKKGYWVERNWDKTARIKTTSVIDTIAVNAVFKDGNKRFIPIGGIAFAGARGISRVELRVDGGPWEQAKLRAPLSETTWVIWRYDWLFSEGEHTFEVRCAEANGTPQIEEKHANRPSGATGIHKIKKDIPDV